MMIFKSPISHQAAMIVLKSGDNTNLARLMSSEVCCDSMYSYKVWLEVPGHCWHWWNTFRLLANCTARVKVCLRLSENDLTDLQLERWLGEPLAAVSILS